MEAEGVVKLPKHRLLVVREGAQVTLVKNGLDDLRPVG